MVAYGFKGVIPKLDSSIGFDLETVDYTPPHGEGVIPDLFLTMSEIKDEKRRLSNATLTITFPNFRMELISEIKILLAI